MQVFFCLLIETFPLHIMNGRDIQQFLHNLGHDISSEWNLKAHELCNMIDSNAWTEHKQHIHAFLNALSEDAYEKVNNNHEVMTLINDCIQQIQKKKSIMSKDCIAYFSLEFGVTQSLHQYAGGLGILAGDHVKTAHDLGLPIIGIGLFYAEGSPHQMIDEEGSQHDIWKTSSIDQLPMSLILDDDGKPLTITVEFPEGIAHVRLHEVMIGNNRLILLDTMHELNAGFPMLQHITDALYFGDREHRLRQELLIGIGGIKALNAIGAKLSFLHVNEGHCAFAMTQWILSEMNEQNISFNEAKSALSTSILFTTHTPVDSGNEKFSKESVLHFGKAHREELQLSEHEFLALGMSDEYSKEVFSMSAMAINIAGATNAVSTLHGRIAHSMWKHLEYNGEKKGRLITSITNGIHTPSWIGEHIAALLDDHIGNAWRKSPHDSDTWKGVIDISHSYVQSAHLAQKQSMLKHLKIRAKARNEHWFEAGNEQALHIGYARRFATYKRALLMFNNPERFHSILNDSPIPIRIIIAGKSHPDDQEGKEIIRKVHREIEKLHLHHAIMFLEDYDIALAKAMVQGCDLWLNTPRRPMEASGTSGMKAAVNGCLHCSILDGWWDEGYAPNRGFKIAHSEDFNEDQQDHEEAESLYDVLEQQVIPLYAGLIKHDGLAWSDMMLHSIAELGPQFSSARMVKEYQERYYRTNLSSESNISV
ncbi:MAG: alpha-glucan family phosphorylase [Candidatus Kapaibacteriota bacterium]